MELRVRREAWEGMWRDARARAPREAVGLLVGRGVAEEAWPLPNASDRPQAHYRAEPLALLTALRRADELGLEVLALYHSHPAGAPLPSAADEAEASWRVPYVILGLPEGQARAFLLPQGDEVKIRVEP
ncbi:MAG TPA: M67 family peptidase [Oceanithermus profundus]|uniref:M67 family peptidase n=1 Tax=Oceanithermus profundus TaxID=187137 RepID=A0A7C4VCW5_9DEIN|nr:M67 family peptidase [Oceanithermus profundus]